VLLQLPFYLLATTTAAPDVHSAGPDHNLLQFLFVGIVFAGAGVAALFYATSALALPWKRALSNTDRQALINAVMITGIALLVGIYTVVEPIRRESATKHHLETSVHRGTANYAQYCVSCHGVAGLGGPVPKELEKGGPAFAPPLANRTDFRPTNPLELAQKGDTIRKVVERGRPNTAMPAWAIAEGGALNSQEVEDLVAFIQHGDFALVRNEMDAATIASVEATAVASGGVADPGAPPGKTLYLSKGCAACHAIQGVSSGMVGPALNGFKTRAQIAGVLPNDKDNLVKWLMNPPAVKPGTAMPNLGLNQADAGQIADYLLQLP